MGKPCWAYLRVSGCCCGRAGRKAQITHWQKLGSELLCVSGERRVLATPVSPSVRCATSRSAPSRTELRLLSAPQVTAACLPPFRAAETPPPHCSPQQSPGTAADPSCNPALFCVPNIDCPAGISPAACAAGGTEGDGLRPSPGAPLNSSNNRHQRGIQKQPRDSRGRRAADRRGTAPSPRSPPRGGAPSPAPPPPPLCAVRGSPGPACARPRLRRWETVPYAGKFGVGFKAPPSGEADCGAPGNRSEGARRGEARGAGSRGRHKWSGGGGGGGGGGRSRRRGGRCHRCGQSCALRSAAA